MVQLASYLRRVLCKTRLIFPRINGPNVLSSDRMKLSNVRSLIVLRLREGLTYANNNVRGIFSG